MNLNIVFCGSPDFPCETLIRLIQDSAHSISVISQPDKIRSRGRKSSPTPVKALAIAQNLPVHTPETKQDFEEIIKKINPDLIIVIAYGMILSKNITSRYYCVNAHASLLPQFRGASPIQASLLNTDTKTGITLIKMNEKMDEGSILLQETLAIASTDNFQSLHDKLATLSAETIITFVTSFQKNSINEGVPQDHSQATYCHKIKKEDLFLNSSDSTNVNLSKIKAFSPIPGAYSIVNEKRIKILDATIKDGEIVPLMVKPEGKKQMTYTDYLIGNNPEITLC
ncbi:methionyl-tRNA formyltransferase [Candidatus Marinamargulisbacteria bacterium SCGC AG-343-D04]|nr:methionyl-tRNA formyltransferase [Candidatus Marinamargulisbacteria bacterium SCGC AG-343-D04]